MFGLHVFLDCDGGTPWAFRLRIRPCVAICYRHKTLFHDSNFDESYKGHSRISDNESIFQKILLE